MSKKRFKKDVELDAQMLYAGMKGMFEPYCIQQGMTTSEAFGRAEWLKKQSRQYIHAVEMEVRRIEQKALSDSLN